MPSKDTMLRYGGGSSRVSWRPSPSPPPSPCTAADDSRSEGSDSAQEVPSSPAMAGRRSSSPAMAGRRCGPVRPQRDDTRPSRVRNAGNPVGRAAPRRDQAEDVRLKSAPPTRRGEKRNPAPPTHPPPPELRRKAAASSSWQRPPSTMVERGRPACPYRERKDVGMLGVVNGCYNGCKEEEASVDLAKSPSNVILLQRVPAAMLETLRRGPRDSGADRRENRRWM